jgi:hypothetical protein
MNNASYISLFRTAYLYTKKNRFLWWYGFIIALTAITQNFQINSSSFNTSTSQLQENYSQLTTSILDNIYLFLGVLFFVLLLFILLYALNILSLASIWNLTSKAKNSNIPGNFSSGFKKSKKFFWSILLTRMILGAILVFVLIILLLPSLFLWFTDNTSSAFIVLICTLTLYIPILIIAFFIRKFAQLYIVLSNIPVLDALDAACILFRKNILRSLVMGLYILGWNLLLAMIFIIGIVAITILGMLFGILLYVMHSTLGTTILIILGISAVVLFSLFIKSIFIVFTEIAWLLFFKKIAAQKNTSIQHQEVSTKEYSYKTQGIQVT